MIDITGKFNTAKVFTDRVEDITLAQIVQLCDQEFVLGSEIRIMPDCHAGMGCTIGTTMTIRDKVVPNLVGFDIGCGMLTCEIEERSVNFPKLDRAIRDNVPAGFNVREKTHEFFARTHLDELIGKKRYNLNRAEKSIGTLGGGNHFIEVERDDDGKLYVIIHTGSRHLGGEIAKYYQDMAFDDIKNVELKEKTHWLIERLKNESGDKAIEKAVKKLKSSIKPKIAKALAYLEGDHMKAYISDMKIAQEFAQINREAILETILKEMNLTQVRKFDTIHNFIDMDSMILRKGAVSAKDGEELLIPINMRDGSLLCVGKGNADWNYSAPHGAGRLYSRTETKNHFSVNEFKKQMEGIFTTTAGKDTLDECPMAYKAMDDIVRNIADTAEITKILKPIYNFKAGEENK